MQNLIKIIVLAAVAACPGFALAQNNVPPPAVTQAVPELNPRPNESVQAPDVQQPAAPTAGDEEAAKRKEAAKILKEQKKQLREQKKAEREAAMEKKKAEREAKRAARKQKSEAREAKRKEKMQQNLPKFGRPETGSDGTTSGNSIFNNSMKK